MGNSRRYSPTRMNVVAFIAVTIVFTRNIMKLHVEIVQHTTEHTENGVEWLPFVNRNTYERDTHSLAAGAVAVAVDAAAAPQSEDAARGFSIFYNIYLDKEEGNPKTEKAYEIIEEQLVQLAESSSLVDLRSRGYGYGSNDVILNYNSIGKPFNTTRMQAMCARHQITCRHLQHYLKGDEALTQQSLWDYCRREETNPSRVVVYLHPKGSFHADDGHGASQHEWRQRHTTAVFSRDCIRPPDRRCNACGLMGYHGFQATWGPLYLGNMWSAKCGYVKKLVSPQELATVYKEADRTKPANMTATLYRFGRFSNAQERFAAEHFVGTHPDLMPCGVAVDKTSNGTRWSMLPLDSFNNGNLGPYSHKFKYKKEFEKSCHHLEWFLMPGYLWRTHVVYGQTPPDDSWAWDYFPDGQAWKARVREQGVIKALQNETSIKSHCQK